VLTRLRIKGIGLSIDDSSTGHASLLALLRLPFTELKIETDRKIVRARISLARELGLSVLAEGIETAAVETRLRSVVARSDKARTSATRCRNRLSMPGLAVARRPWREAGLLLRAAGRGRAGQALRGDW
jgi:hypothetical protein